MTSTTIDPDFAAWLSGTEEAVTSDDQLLPMSPGDSTASLTFVDLLFTLEDHAKTVGRPIEASTVFNRPAGLPELMSVPHGMIETGRYQPRTRFDESELNELADSIREHGIIQPLDVFANERGRLELIGGERRWRAADIVGLSLVPVHIRAFTWRQIAEISSIDNLQRQNLAPLEEGIIFRRLQADFAYSDAELARRLGRPRSYVSQRTAIAGAAPEVQTALDAGEITFSITRALVLGAPDQPKAQLAALKDVQAMLKNGGRANERDAERACTKHVMKQSQATLRALGWSIAEFSPGQWFVWGGGERPRFWNAAELSVAVATKRRPTGDAPAKGAVSSEDASILDRHWRYVATGTIHYTPWIALASHSNFYTFHAASEIPALIATLNDEWAVIVARFAARGWELQSSDHGRGYRASGNGYSERPWNWGDLQKLLTDIEAGNRDAPKKAAAVSSAPVQRTVCFRCRQSVITNTTRYIGQRQYCGDCAKVYEDELAAEKQRIAQEVEALVSPHLVALDLDTLRLFASSMLPSASYSDPSTGTQKLRAMDAAQLVAVMMPRLAHQAYTDRATPVYGAGTVGVPGDNPNIVADGLWEQLDGILSTLEEDLHEVSDPEDELELLDEADALLQAADEERWLMMQERVLLMRYTLRRMVKVETVDLGSVVAQIGALETTVRDGTYGPAWEQSANDVAAALATLRRNLDALADIMDDDSYARLAKRLTAMQHTLAKDAAMVVGAA